MDQSGAEPPHPIKEATKSEQTSPSPLTIHPNNQAEDRSEPGSTDPDPKPEDTIDLSDATTNSSVPRPVHKSTKSVSWSEQLVTESTFTRDADPDSPPNGAGSGDQYDQYADRSLPDSSSTSIKERMDGVKNVLGRWGINVKQAAKRAESLAGDTWQHLKTSPSLTDAAMGRLAHSTKILAEGGYEKIFRHTFETSPDEQLSSTYACYLSTSAGAMMGILYISTSKLAFCSDSPLPSKTGDQTEWSYYKVAIPLYQLKALNPSSSRVDPAEKYIQIISVDGHEYWYMGFLNYDGAVTSLREALLSRDSQV